MVLANSKRVSDLGWWQPTGSGRFEAGKMHGYDYGQATLTCWRAEMGVGRSMVPAFHRGQGESASILLLQFEDRSIDVRS